LDVKMVWECMYGAPTPRERWHAVWLPARIWSATQVADALERDAHTIGAWAEKFGQQGPAGLAFEQSGGALRPRPDATSDTEGGGAGYPAEAGMALANWSWKVVRQFVQDRFGQVLSR
jgi:hypothetical protein